MYLCPVQLFYSSQIEDRRIILSEDETRHAISVLRKSVGDTLQVMDGRGNLFTCTILKASKKETELEIQHSQHYPKPATELHLAVAPTKNMERIEWLLEKSIEIGISSIRFIRCERSERKQVNLERLQKISLAACKQSLTWHFPVLHDMTPFTSYLHSEISGQRFIAVCREAEVVLGKNLNFQNNILLMIGPEGDFTEAEYALARKEGWVGLSLGEKRLRTETAALVGVCGINLWMNE